VNCSPACVFDNLKVVRAPGVNFSMDKHSVQNAHPGVILTGVDASVRGSRCGTRTHVDAPKSDGGGREVYDCE